MNTVANFCTSRNIQVGIRLVTIVEHGDVLQSTNKIVFYLHNKRKKLENEQKNKD